MKTIAILSMSLLLINTFIALTGIPHVLSNPSILYVPSQYPTIREALAAANEGDTIMVASGVYPERNLNITKNGLTLQGQDKANTIIDGGNGNKKIITVNADNVAIRGFTIRNAGTSYAAFGVFLNHSNNILLTNNIFSGCPFLLRAQNCTNVTVTSSVFSSDNYDQGAAFYAIYCQTALIENNTFNADHVGAFIIHSTGFIVRNCTFSSCIYTGVTISYSEQNWVVRNTFINNNSSIAVKYNGNNQIIGNTISNSKTAGLFLGPLSPNNIIHHNNLINNEKQVKFGDSSPPPNVWSTSGVIVEGNYWSDYEGNDANKDGIGDTPYNIAPNNQDQYPLIGPFTEYAVTFQTEQRRIYTISNSTITAFSYNQATKKISFLVSDNIGSLGVCRVVFPKDMVAQPYQVYVNGESKTVDFIANATHVVLYFSYYHASQPSEVVVIPEFPAEMLMAFLFTITLLIAILKRKLRKI